MKKFILSALLLLLILGFAGVAQAAPQVILDDKALSFDVPPTIENGRTLVPLRAIFEALGADVQWDDVTNTVTATKAGAEIRLTIGGAAYKNGQKIVLDVPAKIVEGRTLVPLRFVSESLACQVDWDNKSQTVNIYSTKPYTINKTSLGGGENPPVIVVAAYNSSEQEKQSADYVCSGENDQDVIQSAINAGNAKTIKILSGAYNKDNADGISIPSNTIVELSSGCVINLNKLDTEACIFTNSDHAKGNSNIIIHGLGSLNGNRHLSTAGDQYAVNFTHVTKSKVETYIDNFRTLEARLNQSDCIVKNLRFENMPKEEEIIWRFNDDEMKNSVWVGAPNLWEISNTNSATGNGSLKVVLDKNKQIRLFNNKWKNAGTIHDLRYENISFWLCFEGNYTPEQLNELKSVVSVEFDGVPGHNTITSNFPGVLANSLQWVRAFVCPYNIKSLDRDMSQITRMNLVFDTTHTGSVPGPFTVYVDEVKLVPIKAGGKVAFSADDGFSSWDQIEKILNEYGYHGNYNVAPAKAYQDGQHYKDIISALKYIKQVGGEIASHSYTHNVNENNLLYELTYSKEFLQKEGWGNIDFFALPGGTSVWTGDMITKTFKTYRAVRSTLPAICSDGKTVPIFTTITISLDQTLDSIKNKIACAVNNHENVALYFHRSTGSAADVNEQRLRDICSWLKDKGIPVVTYSEMFPKAF